MHQVVAKPALMLMPYVISEAHGNQYNRTHFARFCRLRRVQLDKRRIGKSREKGREERKVGLGRRRYGKG